MRITQEPLPSPLMTVWIKSRRESPFICIKPLLFIWGLQLAWDCWGIVQTWTPLHASSRSRLCGKEEKNVLDRFLSTGNCSLEKEMEPSQLNSINFLDRERRAVRKSSAVPYWKEMPALLWRRQAFNSLFQSYLKIQRCVSRWCLCLSEGSKSRLKLHTTEVS